MEKNWDYFMIHFKWRPQASFEATPGAATF